MFARTLSIFLLLSSASLIAQDSENSSDPKSQSGCSSPECKNTDRVAAANSIPSVPAKNKWEVEDFKATDAAVSCSVVKYDSTVARPVLHLVCPEREVFAPLRVHLALTWKDVAQIPAAMRSTLVDTNGVVKFKSNKAGESKAELTLQDPSAARSFKQWITFTEVNVGLVLPNK